MEKVIFQECSYPTEHTNRPEIQAIFPIRTFAQYSRLTKTCPPKNLYFTEFIKIQGWLLRTFFICLHNQLSSFNPIVIQMSDKRDSSASFSNFHGKT